MKRGIVSKTIFGYGKLLQRSCLCQIFDAFVAQIVASDVKNSQFFQITDIGQRCRTKFVSIQLQLGERSKIVRHDSNARVSDLVFSQNQRPQSPERLQLQDVLVCHLLPRKVDFLALLSDRDVLDGHQRHRSRCFDLRRAAYCLHIDLKLERNVLNRCLQLAIAVRKFFGGEEERGVELRLPHQRLLDLLVFLAVQLDLLLS